MSKNNSSNSSDNDSSDSSIDWKYTVLNNRYITLKKIDSGAYASVWIALDTNDMKYCAIKINNTEDYKAGKKETKMHKLFKKYKSSNIISVSESFDHETDDGIHHCCVMELMACSLYSIIKSEKYSCGINFKIVMTAIYQVLQGLAHLHNDNIIHGDIKPENILVCGNSKSQKELFDLINIQEIVSKINVETKLNAIKNRKNNRKNKGKQSEKIDIDNLIKKINEKLKNYQNVENDDDDNKTNKLSNSSSICLSDFDKKSKSTQKTTSSFNTASTPASKLSISSDDNSEYTYDTDNSSYNYTDSDNNSLSSFDSSNYDELLKNIKIKIADMGGCLLPDKPRHGRIQTCYYRAPEVLLGLEYGIESDIWALGCSIYELLTGEILFDPHYNKGNMKRHHIYLITKKIGKMLPKHLCNASPNKDIFFTANGKLIKGYKSIDFTKSIWEDLNDLSDKNNLDSETKVQFLDFMKGMLNYDPKYRLSVINALNHPIFKIINELN